MTATATAVAEQLRSDSFAARGAYHALVCDVADGKQRNTAAIRAACFDVGKTLPEFTADVAKAERRRVLAENIKRADKLAVEIAAMEQKKAVLRQAVEAIEKDNWERLNKARSPLGELMIASNDARMEHMNLQQAGQELFRTSHPAIGRRTAALTSQIYEAESIIKMIGRDLEKADGLRKQIAEREPILARLRGMLAAAVGFPSSQLEADTSDKAMTLATLKNRLAALKSKKPELEAARQRVGELQAELAREEARRLDWKCVALFEDDDCDEAATMTEID